MTIPLFELNMHMQQQDSMETDHIPSPPIIQDRRNPTRNRVAPHRAGDSQPTPQRHPPRRRRQREVQHVVELPGPVHDRNVIPNSQINEMNDNAINEIVIENINNVNNDNGNDNNDIANRNILEDALLQASRGIINITSLRNQNIVRKYSKKYVERIHVNDLVYCEICNELWFEDVKGEKNDNDTYKCKRCTTETSEIKKMSKENNMSPMWHDNYMARMELEELQKYYKLTHTEEALIARSVPIMSFMKLKGPINGQNMGFSGNVVNILQDIAPLCAVLPRMISNIGIINVRSKRGTDPGDFKDFKVRRNFILKWLIFLKKWNKSYENISIDIGNLNLLPVNGSILNELLIHEINNNATNNDENNNNNNDDDSEDEEGIQNGPVNELQVDNNNILESGLGLPLPDRDEAETIIQNLINPNAPIPWPTLGTECIDEYNTANILVCSFPCYFPFGVGDVTNKVRPIDVTFNEAIKHYNKYSFKDPNTDKFYYPLAENHRLMHLLQDMDERRRIQSQASVYLHKNQVDANLTINELQDMARNRNDSQSFALNLRMQTFAANILCELLLLKNHKITLMLFFYIHELVDITINRF